jgi:hypothetical protein
MRIGLMAWLIWIVCFFVRLFDFFCSDSISEGLLSIFCVLNLFRYVNLTISLALDIEMISMMKAPKLLLLGLPDSGIPTEEIWVGLVLVLILI